MACFYSAPLAWNPTGVDTRDLFDAVQARLAANGVERHSDHNLRHANLLGGLLYDGLGRRMKANHANKGSRRYHYYVTCPTAAQNVTGPIWRISASDIETLVDGRLRAFLVDPAPIHDAVDGHQYDAAALIELLANADKAARSDGCVILELVQRIDVHDDQLRLHVCLDALLPEAAGCVEPLIHILVSPIQRLRRIRGVQLVLVDDLRQPHAPDPALVKLVVAAHHSKALLAQSPDRSIAQIAADHGYSQNYFTMLLRLVTLAPDIVTAILDGRQPSSLPRQRLARATSLPIEWAAQRTALGF